MDIGLLARPFSPTLFIELKCLQTALLSACSLYLLERLCLPCSISEQDGLCLTDDV